MMRKMAVLFLLISFLAGCGLETAVIVGAAAVGTGSGTYFYINGEMNTDYYHSFDKVWKACEKTIADLKGYDVQPEKGIGDGKIVAYIDDEKVKFSLKYKSKDVTTVSIRVGILGNKVSSQLLHDKILENIAKN